MVDLLRTIVRVAYWYGLSVGVVNFEVDWRKGKAIATRRVTIYAALHNLCLITLLCFLSVNHNSLKSDFSNARYLHEYFFLLITVVRYFAVLLSLISRWIQRTRILRLGNQLAQMVREKHRVFLQDRHRIYLKFFICFMSDCLHMILDLSAQREKINFNMVINLLIWSAFTTIFNSIVFQYYLAVSQIFGLYNVIQQDLRKLMSEAETICLTCNHRGGVFALKCCALADKLDDLAERQNKLQHTLSEMSDVCQIQSFSMSLVYYLSTMGSIYFTFCSIIYNKTGFGSTYLGLSLIALSTAFFYADNWMSISIGIKIRDQQNKVMRILADRTLLSPELDKRLEMTFESFQLQLVRDPHEFYVLGLFKVDRSQLLSMMNSVIVHSILLVQWELQHN
ncbi:putative gustatory receptor 59c [Drosophila ficusphila]|uniref:putative gustatory receptor 59c n=1 Tax=Drosophila ficusphila TaxID=30025 RepID=UPI0007E66FEC|nr:putative gustatory receptor 59c [Drosophila ficusphila]